MLIHVNGRTQTLSQWSRETGTPISTIKSRMRRGLSNSEAVLAPAREQTSWDDNARDERLVELWGIGFAASEIAMRLTKEFGGRFTKNMVIGRARRLGLEHRPSPIRSAVSPEERKRRKLLRQLKVRVSKAAQSNRLYYPRKKKRLVLMASDYVPDPTKVTGTSIFAAKCAFPLWSHGERPSHQYCGQPVSAGSYCTHHAGVAYGGKTWPPKESEAA